MIEDLKPQIFSFRYEFITFHLEQLIHKSNMKTISTCPCCIFAIYCYDRAQKADICRGWEGELFTKVNILLLSFLVLLHLCEVT
jgi:hypothetical protein